VSRFASCALGERRFAALVEGDEVRPLEGVSELGAETPSLPSRFTSLKSDVY